MHIITMLITKFYENVKGVKFHRQVKMIITRTKSANTIFNHCLLIVSLLVIQYLVILAFSMYTKLYLLNTSVKITDNAVSLSTFKKSLGTLSSYSLRIHISSQWQKKEYTLVELPKFIFQRFLFWALRIFFLFGMPKLLQINFIC